ncbi:cell wall-associated NlpC family hydrolase [Rhodococcus sp. AG1013]|uniref:C40 family peptidase n=1 Tax=Rhodococcus sp. AG1013 TaxID=2183996 RepID=UPI000E0BA3FC|nr:C40 family peptidase [Rhodococcus sp. AG1013]RDI32568.1 cell wall-associated NlpC family hydrolase [Rhodococcus sp. AG1013]
MASSTFTRSARRAAVAGALAVGAVTVSAAPALADPINIPGVGTVEVPGVTQQQVDAAIASITPSIPEGIVPGVATGSAAAVPAPLAPIVTAGEKAVEAARAKLGAPYVYGAAGPDAFDCSGLVQWAYKQAGLNLPRTSYDQAAAGFAVAQSDLRVGDVISFYGGSHSGIYAGDGNVIHASTAGQPVKLAPVSSMPFDGARRYA